MLGFLRYGNICYKQAHTFLERANDITESNVAHLSALGRNLLYDE